MARRRQAVVDIALRLATGWTLPRASLSAAHSLWSKLLVAPLAVIQVLSNFAPLHIDAFPA